MNTPPEAWTGQSNLTNLFQSILAESAFLRSLAVNSWDALCTQHQRQGYRSLEQSEIKQLIAQGNLCRDWSKI